MKRIFIATNYYERYNTEKVVKLLKKAGHDPIIYNADEVFARKKNIAFSVGSGKDKPAIFTYDGQVINAETVGAAWYWRPNSFFSGRPEDKAKYMSLSKELKALQDGMLETTLPEKIWFNSPRQMAPANSKMLQLCVAKLVGFRIPDTVISNEWSAVTKLSSPIIMKMNVGQMYEANKVRIMYTTILDDRKVKRLQATNPFPAIFQEYVGKAREWRVTVVGNKVFPVAIYTKEQFKDDWRKPVTTENDDQVRFVHEPIASDVAKKCLAMTRKLKLNYGAFDLVESPDGTITFLEVNTNGQFRGFETATHGLHISEEIANNLIRLARKNSVKK